MESNSTVELILSWARDFRVGELTVEDIQDRFSALQFSEDDLPLPFRNRLTEAQLELDVIRFGMCESGQRAEIKRIFVELERLV